MAINKQIETAAGDDTNHHVFQFEFNNMKNKVYVTDSGYVNAAKFNNKKAVRESVQMTFALTDFPVATRQAIKAALTAIEDYLITIPRYEGGTRVKDNGDPL